MTILAGTAGLAAFSMVVLVAGYLAVAGLFYAMVYRPNKQAKREARERVARKRDDED